MYRVSKKLKDIKLLLTFQKLKPFNSRSSQVSRTFQYHGIHLVTTLANKLYHNNKAVQNQRYQTGPPIIVDFTHIGVTY